MDTWLLVRSIESNGERNRGLYVLKSRGMPHSNQIREFVLSNEGIQLLDVYVGAEKSLPGSARLAQESRAKAAASQQQQEIARRSRELERERQAVEAQIANLRAGLEAKAEQFKLEAAQNSLRESAAAQAQLAIGKSRMADKDFGSGANHKPHRNGA